MIQDWWSRCSLAQQFAMVGSFVVVCGMAVIGSWVAKEIEHAVIQNTAASTALYMDSIIAPHIQELEQEPILSTKNQQAVDEILTGTEIGKRITSAKVWKEGGRIAYSTRKSIIGSVFPVTPNLNLAWTGKISAEFDTLEDEEDALERHSGLPFLEIYSPIRERSGRIIAVAEFYENAALLKKDLFRAQSSSWIVVGVVTLTMIGLLSGIVLRGSRTIESQRHSLVLRVEQLSELKNRLERSSRLATELNESFLRRLGSELHDGPAQLIGLGLLRLDQPNQSDEDKNLDTTEGWQDQEVIRNALSDALSEIRNISAGLVLPEFEDQPLLQGISRIISIHEQRTQVKVFKDLSEFPNNIDKSIKISVVRMVQEGLNNSFRHASGAPVKVTSRTEGKIIQIEVADEGPGFDTDLNSNGMTTSLGLPGLRERIESIGGQFTIQSEHGVGTTITAEFTL